MLTDNRASLRAPLEQSPGHRTTPLARMIHGGSITAAWSHVGSYSRAAARNRGVGQAPCRMRKKSVQQGRSERRGESYSLPYVERLSDARTPLAAFFRILLEVFLVADERLLAYCLFGWQARDRPPGSLVVSMSRYDYHQTVRNPVVRRELVRRRTGFPAPDRHRAPRLSSVVVSA